MKKIIFLVLISLVVLFISGCANQAGTSSNDNSETIADASSAADDSNELDSSLEDIDDILASVEVSEEDIDSGIEEDII